MSFEVGDRVQWHDDPETTGTVIGPGVYTDHYEIEWDNNLGTSRPSGDRLRLIPSPVKSTPEVDPDACLCPSLLLGHEDGCPHKGRYARTHVLH